MTLRRLSERKLMSKAHAQSLRIVRFLEALDLTSCLPSRSGCLDKVCGLVGMAAPQFTPKVTPQVPRPSPA
jgi:hypothetical protein